MRLPDKVNAFARHAPCVHQPEAMEHGVTVLNMRKHEGWNAWWRVGVFGSLGQCLSPASELAPPLHGEPAPKSPRQAVLKTTAANLFSNTKRFWYIKGGSIKCHLKVFFASFLSVLSSCGLFWEQFACSFSRIARYTPSLTNKIVLKKSLTTCQD